MPAIPKLSMQTPDGVATNVDKIRELFPNCVTEARDEATGELTYAVDFDQLKQELSGEMVDGPTERYQLTWPGKRQAILTANAPIRKTLRPAREESVNFDTTQNLFIEGDNLDALKLLQETYLGKVKMIYIDPPYNTGKDFVYKDNFTENTQEYLERSGQKDEEGNRLQLNTDSNGRYHSDWLTMMYSRLKIARNLLAPDGVIFISIDDNEAGNLIQICNGIFGPNKFVADLAVQLNPRGRNLDKFIAKTHEHLLVYTKDIENQDAMIGLEKTGSMLKEYNKVDENGPYRLIGLRNRNQSFNPVTRPNLFYPLYVCEIDKSISTKPSEKHLIEVWPDTSEGTKTCWTWGNEKVSRESEELTAEVSGGRWTIFRKDYLNNIDGTVARTLPKSVWLDKEINNDFGKKSIKELFGKSIMSFPKSTFLIEKITKFSTAKDSLVLDFFAGSGTTGHAVMKLNAEDGGNRKYICVQLPEVTDEKSEAHKAGYANISEITKERLRRAGKKIKEEHPDWKGDTGFRVLKIDTTSMRDVYYTPTETIQSELVGLVDNLKDDRSAEDLLFQVMLDMGVPLDLPIQLEKIEGVDVYTVANNDLVACFAKAVTEDLVKAIAKRNPDRVVFRDAAFTSDSAKINAEQVRKHFAPNSTLKVL